jgi:ribosomal protein L30E
LADKAESVIFDNTKIKTFVPEFKATIPFVVGIKRTLKWLDENPKMKIVSQETNQRIDNILKAYQKLS